METKNYENQPDVEAIIKRHTYWAVGAGLIPVPLADIAAVTAIQLDMLKALCKLYDVDYSQEKGKSWISALAGSTLSSMAASFGASAVKAVPLIGTFIGITSMSIMSGAVTYALGNVFAQHFEGGGSLSNFKAENVKKYYREKLNEGKELAKELKEKYLTYSKSKEGMAKQKSVAEKIEELEDLLEQRLITEEEYHNLRIEILKNLVEN